MPGIDDRPSKPGDAKFTTLKLVSLPKKDREKTGFECELGFYQWKRVPSAWARRPRPFKD